MVLAINYLNLHLIYKFIYSILWLTIFFIKKAHEDQDYIFIREKIMI